MKSLQEVAKKLHSKELPSRFLPVFFALWKIAEKWSPKTIETVNQQLWHGSEQGTPRLHLCWAIRLAQALCHPKTGAQNCADIIALPLRKIEYLPNMFMKSLQGVAKKLHSKELPSRFSPVFSALRTIAGKLSPETIETVNQQLWHGSEQGTPRLHPWWAIRHFKSITNGALWGKKHYLPEEAATVLCRYTLFSPQSRRQLAQVNKSWREVVVTWEGKCEVLH